MKNIKIYKISFLFLNMLFGHFAFSNEHVTMSLEKISKTDHSIEFDLVLINDGSSDLLLSAWSYGLNINEPKQLENEIKCIYIPGSRSKEFLPFGDYSLGITSMNQVTQFQFISSMVPYGETPVLMQQAKFKVGRFRIETKMPWLSKENLKLGSQRVQQMGLTNSQILAYVGSDGTVTPLNESKKSLTIREDESSLYKVGNDTNEGILNVYPNPVTTTLNIDFFALANTSVDLYIQNAQGQQIKQFKMNVLKGKNVRNITVDDLIPGIYILQYTSAGKLSQKQFSVQ